VCHIDLFSLFSPFPCSGDILDLDCLVLNQVKVVISSKPFRCAGTLKTVPAHIRFTNYRCADEVVVEEKEQVIVHQGKNRIRVVLHIREKKNRF
jgi:hypothetical protein